MNVPLPHSPSRYRLWTCRPPPTPVFSLDVLLGDLSILVERQVHLQDPPDWMSSNLQCILWFTS